MKRIVLSVLFMCLAVVAAPQTGSAQVTIDIFGPGQSAMRMLILAPVRWMDRRPWTSASPLWTM